MIRIQRPETPPEPLRSKGEDATERLCRDHEAGRREFEFDKGVYGAPVVKQALARAQGKKCAYCESLILHAQPGDVEHYRPKAGFVAAGKRALERPGYYWLAYQWNNLLLVCEICNRSWKKNHFPLADETRRARTHGRELADEEPLLLDPACPIVDPEDHIEFRAEIPFAKGQSRRGETTIRLVGLDRDELNEVRRDRLEATKMLIDIYLLAKDPKLPAIDAATKRRLKAYRSQLVRLVASKREFSAMHRRLIRREAPELLD